MKTNPTMVFRGSTCQLIGQDNVLMVGLHKLLEMKEGFHGAPHMFTTIIVNSFYSWVSLKFYALYEHNVFI